MDPEEPMQMDEDDVEMKVEDGNDSDYEDVEEASDGEDSGDSEDESDEDEGILGDSGVSAKPKTKKDKLKKLGIEQPTGESIKAKKAKAPKPKKAYLPGMQLKEDETLQCDESAYITLHTFTTLAPCLSFDIIPDSAGPDRTKFPLTSYIVGGTQAQRSHANHIIVMKVCIV